MPSAVSSRVRSEASRLGSAINHFKTRHGVLTGGLIAFTAASLSALALAIAPLTADNASLPPQRVLAYPVQPLEVMPQLESLADHPMAYANKVTLRGPSSLAAVLAKAGVVDAAAASALAADPVIKQVMAARGVRTVDLFTAPDGSLHWLRIRQAAAQDSQALTHFQRLTATRGNGKWQVQDETLPLSVTPRFASGVIRYSLFQATDEVGIPDVVAIQLAELFSGDIDFHRQLRKGDRFSVVYEALTADGEPAAWSQGAGRILAAEFLNDGREHQAIWYESQAATDGGEYYDAEGRARKRPFLASPLEFSRVTSGFALRLHPILKEWRAHRGIDYGAPTGTPVRTVGDGIVTFAGVQPGYGNVIEISHTKDRSTLYAHLSRIDVRVGQRVNQGSTVGAVGSTGMSTGPHLHFEFRLAGVHQDPDLLAKQTGGMPLEPGELAGFNQFAQAMRANLDWAADQVGSGTRSRFE